MRDTDRQFDVSCLVAFIMTYLSNVLKYIQIASRSRGNGWYGYGSSSGSSSSPSWRTSPSDIEGMFAKRSSIQGLEDVASMCRAIALFSLFVPIFQVCWILSRGGKCRIINHITIVVLALAGGLCELLSSLMMTGTRSMASFLSRRFELNDWEVCGDNGDDGIGWRVLEMSYMMNVGLTVWVNAFEWICLTGIFTLLLIDVLAEHRVLKEDANSFTKNWAILGFIIGIFGLYEFVSDIMRAFNWRFFSSVSHTITIINLWVLIPIWLTMLGMKLPTMKDKFENREEEAEPLAEENAVTTIDTVVFN